MRVASPTGGFVGKMSSVAYALAILILLAGIAFKYKLLEAPAFMIPRSEDLLPLRAPKMVELAELKDASYKDAMLWGSYRSGLYFGMRTRSPKSLLTGLMWFNPDSMDTLRNRKVWMVWMPYLLKPAHASNISVSITLASSYISPSP